MNSVSYFVLDFFFFCKIKYFPIKWVQNKINKPSYIFIEFKLYFLKSIIYLFTITYQSFIYFFFLIYKNLQIYKLIKKNNKK